MLRSTRPSVSRGRATPKLRRSTVLQKPSSSQGRGARVEKPSTRGRTNNRACNRKRAAETIPDARDVEPTSSLPGFRTTPEQLDRQESIHPCSESSLEFIQLSGLETGEDTNTIALNLMDYFLFSPENWLPRLSYCKLHAACFLFASRITGKSNTVEEIAAALGPDSEFIKLVGSPLAEDDDSAVAIQYTISVAEPDVEDGYALLYERKEMFTHLVGQYIVNMESLPSPVSVTETSDTALEDAESENFDVWEDDT